MEQRNEIPLQSAEGIAQAHFGELLQGMFIVRGRLVRALITLPCPEFRVTAKFEPTSDRDIRSVPSCREKSIAAIKNIFGERCIAEGGVITLDNNFPSGMMRAGMGSSTADVTAAVIAAYHALGIEPADDVVAREVVKAEDSGDPLYKNRGVLFGHRDGIVFEDFGENIPPMRVVGMNTDTTGEGVDTLKHPPANYRVSELEQFAFLHNEARNAIQTQDPVGIARVATGSATINQRYLRNNEFPHLKRMIKTWKALGVAVSHSGTVGGLLYPPDVDEDLIQTVKRIFANCHSPIEFRTDRMLNS